MRQYILSLQMTTCWSVGYSFMTLFAFFFFLSGQQNIAQKYPAFGSCLEMPVIVYVLFHHPKWMWKFQVSFLARTWKNLCSKKVICSVLVEGNGPYTNLQVWVCLSEGLLILLWTCPGISINRGGPMKISRSLVIWHIGKNFPDYGMLSLGRCFCLLVS